MTILTVVKIWKEYLFPVIISFGKAPAVSLKLTLKLEIKRFFKEASQNLLYTPLQLTQTESFATGHSFLEEDSRRQILRRAWRSEPLLAWKRANWVQETCLFIQATLLRTASFYFHKRLQKCFPVDYDHLFNSPVNNRVDNNTSGHTPIYIPAAG